MSNEKIKVCYVLPHFYPYVGGGEQAFLDLIEELIKKNVEVRVVTSHTDNTGNHQVYKGIDIYYYDWKSLFGHPIVNKKDIEEHVKWADIVHTGVYSPVRKACKVAKKFHKPSVVTVHEVLGKRWFWVESNKIKALAFKMYEKFIVKVKCDYFHTPSHATEKDLIACNKKAKVKNIYWIVDEEKKKIEVDKAKFYNYFNITEKDKVFLNYGRPGKTKGVFIYLEAIEKVIKELGEDELKNTKFCFIMAKEPRAEREKFLKRIKENNIEKYVIVKESVDRNDLENYIMCADYVVVPSITEGFGLTAIEACNMEKKVIHSSGGSLPEVTFGTVVQFENQNSEDLKEKLEEIIKGNLEFNNKARKDFSKETITNEVINLYEDLLKNAEEK